MNDCHGRGSVVGFGAFIEHVPQGNFQGHVRMGRAGNSFALSDIRL